MNRLKYYVGFMCYGYDNQLTSHNSAFPPLAVGVTPTPMGCAEAIRELTFRDM